MAAQDGHDEVVRRLVAAGASPDACDADGLSPLLGAAKRGWHRVVLALVDAGVSQEVTDEIGWHPLHWSAWHGHVGCVNALLMANANPNAVTPMGESPLHCAGTALALVALGYSLVGIVPLINRILFWLPVTISADW